MIKEFTLVVIPKPIKDERRTTSTGVILSCNLIILMNIRIIFYLTDVFMQETIFVSLKGHVIKPDTYHVIHEMCKQNISQKLDGCICPNVTPAP